jgi:hypothetical protein
LYIRHLGYEPGQFCLGLALRSVEGHKTCNSLASAGIAANIELSRYCFPEIAF